jgi:hypothetical protein
MGWNLDGWITFCKNILFEYLMHVSMNIRRLMSMVGDWFMRPLMAAEAVKLDAAHGRGGRVKSKTAIGVASVLRLEV